MNCCVVTVLLTVEKIIWSGLEEDLKDFIEEPSYKIDEKGHEGWLFEKLKKELVENNKLNYNYGRDKQK